MANWQGAIAPSFNVVVLADEDAKNKTGNQKRHLGITPAGQEKREI